LMTLTDALGTPKPPIRFSNNNHRIMNWLSL